MGPFTATDLSPTVSHRQFALGLVIIVLLRLVIVGDDSPPTYDYYHYNYIYKISFIYVDAQ